MSKEIIDKYIAELKARRIGAKSINAYRQILTDLEIVAPLEEYNKDILIQYFNNLRTHKRFGEQVLPQESTVQHKQRLCQKFFRDMGKPEVISWFKFRKLPEKLKDTDMLKDNDVNILIETAHSHYSKALISFLYDTGARISEAMKLKYADLYEEDGHIIVHIPTSKTAAGFRKTVLTFSDMHIRNLKTYTERKEEDFIFCKCYSQNERLVKDIAKKSGLDKKVTLHLFRHSHATQLVENGTQEAIIRKELGWSPTSPMIARYQHFNDDAVIKSKLEKAGMIKPNEVQHTEIKQPDTVNVITMSKKLSKLTEENEQLRHDMEQQKTDMQRQFDEIRKIFEKEKEKLPVKSHLDLLLAVDEADGKVA
jgi:integrase/recombinase XerD